MRAWIKHEGRLQLLDGIPTPAQRSNEMFVKVEAISLNRGEVRAAALAKDGAILGWDVAGTVASAAPDGSGPPAGARVTAILRASGWAEYAAVPVNNAAVIPEGVSTAIAATLPVAGLTVMRTFAAGGSLLGKRVLITGASGGVGTLAVQLAAMAGATVTGIATEKHAAAVRALGASEIVAAIQDAPGAYDLILEGVGGASMAAAIERVAAGGVIVSIGNSSEEETTFNVRTLYRKSGAMIYALLIFDEVDQRRVGSRELGHLLELVRSGALRPGVEVERSWRELDKTLADLEHRRFAGKAVLNVD